MKKLALIIIASVMSLNLFAHEISKEEWKNMSKQERKEYKLEIAKVQQKQIMQLMTSKAWVLEAHQIQDKYGETAIIEPSINFVGVAGENATAQLGSSGDIGWNGVGGITVEGSVQSYKLKEGSKPGSGANLRIDISGASAGHISMSIQISADGTASATLSDNFGDKLTYRGRIVSLAESSVYKGQVVF